MDLCLAGFVLKGYRKSEVNCASKVFQPRDAGVLVDHMKPEDSSNVKISLDWPFPYGVV
jgi:hypothetical protein